MTARNASEATAHKPVPALDLALRLETNDGDPLPASLANLLTAAGPLTDPERAQGHWQDLVEGWLAQLAAELPAELRSSGYSLGLLLTDDASIAALNSTWRHRNEPTDVLSFAALECGLEDAPPLPLPPDLFEDAALFDAEDGVERCEAQWKGPDDHPGDAWEPDDEPLELGDIVISLETADRQASAAGSSLEAELLFLASHGLLHLLGWDHPDEASLATMLSRQEALIAAAGQAASGSMGHSAWGPVP